jgi:hypothetical protein
MKGSIAKQKLRFLMDDYCKNYCDHKLSDDFFSNENDIKISVYSKLINDMIHNINIEFVKYGYDRQFVNLNDLLTNLPKNTNINNIIIKHIDSFDNLNLSKPHSEDMRIYANYYFGKLFLEKYFSAYYANIIIFKEPYTYKIKEKQTLKKVLMDENIIKGQQVNNYLYINNFNDIYTRILNLDDKSFFRIIKKLENVEF